MTWIDVLQSYLTMSGLLADILGVVIVGNHWIKTAGNSLQRLLKAQTDLNLKWANEAQKAREKLSVLRATGASWWQLFPIELDLALRRTNARIYQSRVSVDRSNQGLAPLSVLSKDDYWNIDAIKIHSEEMRGHFENVIADGAPNNRISVWGIRLIIVGFLLQFLGAIPV
ncbi:MAG: hypothetical protein KKH72_02920 [Alphaproteobacteria bacterium]|nr:hypothetical protein [Alphaproteobacteria bacterium]